MSTRWLFVAVPLAFIFQAAPQTNQLASMARAADQDDPVKAILRDLRREDKEKRIAAAEAAQKLGPKAKAAARELCHLALSPDGDVKLAALEALETIEPDLYPHAVTLANATFVTDLVKAGKAVGELGEKGAAATPLLLHHLKANLTQGHLEALSRMGGVVLTEALGKVGAADDEAIEWLFARMRAEDKREAATRDRAAMLAAIANMARAREDLREPAIKVIVDTAMGRYGRKSDLRLLGGMAPESVKTLRGLKVNPDEEVRKIAAELLKSAMPE